MSIGRTGVRRNQIFLRTSAEGGGGGNTEGGGGNNQQSEWKPPASQEEFDQIIERRLQRERNRYKDYDSYKEKATQYDALVNESQTEKEREVARAREEAFNEAMGKAVPKAVRAEFRAAAKGVLSKEQLDSLLEDLDLTKYATDEGEPDEDKIAKKIAAFAPRDDKGKGNNGKPPAFGQGTRESSTPAKGEAGLAEAKRRFPEAFASAK